MFSKLKEGQNIHSKHCFVCGKDNSSGFQINCLFNEEYGEIRFTYDPQSFQISSGSLIHGGVIAAILDEAQGALCDHLGYAVMTDTLEVKYRQAASLGDQLQVRAWLSTARKKRLYTKATIHNQYDQLIVSSSGIWYNMPRRLMKRVWSSMGEEELKNFEIRLEANRKRAREIHLRLKRNRS